MTRHSEEIQSPDASAMGWLLAGLAAAAIPLCVRMPFWVPVGFVGLGIWRLVIERRVSPIPGKRVRLTFFGVALAGVVFSHGNLFSTEAALSLLVILLGLKVLEVRSCRDYAVASLAGYFVVLCNFFHSQSLALVLYLLPAPLFLTAGLIRLSAGRGANLSPFRTLRVALGVLAPTVPLLVVLFVLFPRLDSRFAFRVGENSDGVTGMSDQMDPGAFERLMMSTEPAFRADFPNGNPPPQRDQYWRGLVLEVCNGLAWQAGPRALPVTKVPAVDGPVIVQTITLEPHNQRWLFALDRPVKWVPGAELLRNQTLLNRTPVRRLIRYTVESGAVLPDPGNIAAKQNERLLAVPANLSPRLVALAASWKEGATDAREVARRGLRFFQEGGFVYSLAPGAYAGSDPLEEFVFGRKRGLCEHYAAAFATLMRSAGVRARVVIGYQGGVWNSVGGYIGVRQSDAHAWVEIWQEGVGWLREDPTAAVAPDRLEFGMESFSTVAQLEGLSSGERRERLMASTRREGIRGWGRQVVEVWDHLDHQWDLLVVGYDSEAQGELARFLGLAGKGSAAPGLWTALGVCVLGLLGVSAAWIFRRPRELRAAPLMELFVRILGRAGIQRQPWEGVVTVAERAAESHPEAGEDVTWLAAELAGWRYGREPMNASRVRELKRALRRLRGRLRAGRK